MARMKWFGDDVKRRAHAAAADGLYEAAEYVLETANRTVPHEEGMLSDSGFTDVDRGALVAAVSYDTPYAVRQHEELDYRHAPGRRAKWLEQTVNEEASAIDRHIGRKISEALR